MQNYIVYNTQTGSIIRYGTCQESDVELQMMNTNEAVLQCDYQDGIVVNGSLVPYTVEQLSSKSVCPGLGYEWNDASLSWIDTRTLGNVQASAKDRLLAARDQLDYGNFTCNGVSYTASPDDQRRIAGAVQLAVLAQGTQQPFSIIWDDASANPVTLDGPGMIAVGIALGTSVQTAFARYRTALAAVNAATTNSAVDAIVI